MNRRKFLYLSGVAVAATTTLSATALLKEDKKIQKRVTPADFDQPVLKAIAYGINAPNPHNTQAWKFELLSDHELLFFVDETRILPATDPTTRQIHIGCGCFLECSKIGMTLEGFDTQITYFPDSTSTYSIDQIGQVPIAKVTYIPKADWPIDPLAQHLFERKTSRLNYSDAPISKPDFEGIHQLTQPQGSDIQLITDSDRLNTLLPILSAGMNVETNTYNTHEESRKWFRENDERIEAKRDGINLPGNGLKGLKKWIAERQLKGLPTDKWHSKKLNEYSLNAHEKRVTSSKGLVTLKTQSNTVQDWLNAGVDYVRLQLACHHYGYSIHPLSQVLQEFEEMEALRLQFEQEMGISPGKGKEEKIQMAVRIGKSKKAYQSFRRPVNSLIV